CGSTWTPPAPSQSPVPTPTPAPAPTVTLTHPTSQTARVGEAVHLQLRASDSAGQALTWRASGLPSGLSIASSTGLVSGTPKRARKSTSTITVTDASGVSAHGTIPWTVAGRPTITGGLRINRGHPFLSLKVGAGA